MSPPALRGFGPLGLAALALILAGNFLFAPLSALLVLAWAYASETPWPELGFVRPRSWTKSLVIGIAFGALFKLAMKAIVMPLLGAPPLNTHYHFLAGNTAALPGMLYAVIIGPRSGVEMLYRGHMFDRLRKLLDRTIATQI